jgi:hypothetical protein
LIARQKSLINSDVPFGLVQNADRARIAGFRNPPLFRKPGRPRKRAKRKATLTGTNSLCSRLEIAIARIAVSVERLENL